MYYVLGIVGVLVVGYVLMWFNARRARLARDRRIEDLIAPALQALEGGSGDALDLVQQCAKAPATRNSIRWELKERGKEHLFPEEYKTLAMVAESDLVRWLMHGNELGDIPDCILLANEIRVPTDQGEATVFLFKFRAAPSHWAAERGWMAGISGPFWDHEKDVYYALHSFSELTPYADMSDVEHINYLHTCMNRMGLVVKA